MSVASWILFRDDIVKQTSHVSWRIPWEKICKETEGRSFRVTKSTAVKGREDDGIVTILQSNVQLQGIVNSSVNHKEESSLQWCESSASFCRRSFETVQFSLPFLS